MWTVLVDFAFLLKVLEVFELLCVFTETVSSFAAPLCVFGKSIGSFVLLCLLAESMAGKTEVKKILIICRKKAVGKKNKNKQVGGGIEYRQFRANKL